MTAIASVFQRKTKLFNILQFLGRGVKIFDIKPIKHLQLGLSVSNIHINNVEKILESLSDETSHVLQQKIFELDNYNRYWPYQLHGQQTLAALMHGLYQKKRYSDIQILTDKLNSISFDTWGGLATTIIYSTMKQKKWNEVIKLFEAMKVKGQIKHSRLHKTLIVELIENDKIDYTLKYFKEFSQLEKQTIRLKASDIKMLTSLIKGVLKNKNCDLSRELVHCIISYLQTKDNKLSSDFIADLVRFFSSAGKYSVSKCKTNTTCENCQTNLVTSENLSLLCENILMCIEKMPDSDDIKKVQVDSDCFEIIVDAGNVLYHGKGKSQRVKAGESLNSLILDIFKRYSKARVALVFPRTYAKSDKMKDFIFLNELLIKYNPLLKVFIPKCINDDLLIIYLAAKSELRRKLIGIISNDGYVDHTHVAGIYLDAWNFFLRQRVKPFNNQGIVEFSSSIPSVSLHKKHIHLNDQCEMWCVSKNILS